MKNIFKNKLTFILIVLLSLIFSFTSSVFAVDFNNRKTNTDVSLSDIDSENPYFINYYNGNYYLYLMDTKDGKFLYQNGYNYSNVGMTQYNYNFSTCTWSSYRHYSSSSGVGAGDVVFTSLDIVYYDDYSNVFFLSTPQVKPMEITQVEEIPQSIITIAKILLPTCLSVFGILLVLFLIKSKNLLQL